MKDLDEIMRATYEVEEILTGTVSDRLNIGFLSDERAAHKSSTSETFNKHGNDSSYLSDLESLRLEIQTRVSGDLFHQQEQVIAERIAEIWQHIIDKNSFSDKNFASGLNVEDFLPTAVQLRRSDALSAGPIAVVIYAHRHYLLRNATLYEVEAFLDAAREMNLGPADVIASFARKAKKRSLVNDLGVMRAFFYFMTCLFRILLRKPRFNLAPFHKKDLFYGKALLDIASQAWSVKRS